MKYKYINKVAKDARTAMNYYSGTQRDEVTEPHWVLPDFMEAQALLTATDSKLNAGDLKRIEEVAAKLEKGEELFPKGSWEWVFMSRRFSGFVRSRGSWVITGRDGHYIAYRLEAYDWRCRVGPNDTLDEILAGMDAHPKSDEYPERYQLGRRDLVEPPTVPASRRELGGANG